MIEDSVENQESKYRKYDYDEEDMLVAVFTLSTILIYTVCNQFLWKCSNTLVYCKMIRFTSDDFPRMFCYKLGQF